ncbi:MAG: twin-arginine translocase subunit TatB, partial [Bdellovibrionales bacterium]|nr:twin-arginine translocase subunit TatB [Bdellovibrionales bacterium]
MELSVICLGILLFVGPAKLPEVASQLGKMFIKMRRVSNEVKSNFDSAMRKVEDEIIAEER